MSARRLAAVALAFATGLFIAACTHNSASQTGSGMGMVTVRMIDAPIDLSNVQSGGFCAGQCHRFRHLLLEAGGDTRLLNLERVLRSTSGTRGGAFRGGWDFSFYSEGGFWPY